MDQEVKDFIERGWFLYSETEKQILTHTQKIFLAFISFFLLLLPFLKIIFKFNFVQ